MPSITHGQIYIITAQIINKIADKEIKQAVADHFATEFRKKFKAFDPNVWERATGGKVKGFDIHTGLFEDGTKG